MYLQVQLLCGLASMAPYKLNVKSVCKCLVIMTVYLRDRCGNCVFAYEGHKPRR